MSIFLTGSTGFVGKSLISYFADQIPITKYKRNSVIDIQEDIVIHLAGKAHDLKQVTSAADYYKVNTEFAKKVFNSFITSKAKVFIILSSAKAVADEVNGELFEDVIPNPVTDYGKSKLLAEQYILSKSVPINKRIYILRPCMIHGIGNKGNLNLLYKIVSKGLPWPLGAFENKRSFCSVDNLCFVIKELINNDQIPSGLYNISDDIALSTNEVITIIAESRGKKANILKLNMNFIKILARVGDFLNLPLNSERLQKLTESYIVSNAKIKLVLGKQLPVSSKDGLIKTIQSFSHNV
jgi:nucleoside-diphosphate-sugar epimerase